MCKRYSRTATWTDLEQLLGLLEVTDPLAPSYNVAPTHRAPVIHAGPAPGALRGGLFRWGLVPAWSDDPGIGARLANARAETVHDKPAFRRAFAERRCLVPMSGFYEWDQSTTPSTPYWFGRRDRRTFMLAGLWEPPVNTLPETAATFTILTTEPSDLVKPVHHRMPVIVPPERWGSWLASHAPREELRAVLAPASEAAFERFRVSRLVNNARNDGPEVAAPHDESDQIPETLF